MESHERMMINYIDYVVIIAVLSLAIFIWLGKMKKRKKKTRKRYGKEGEESQRHAESPPSSQAEPEPSEIQSLHAEELQPPPSESPPEDFSQPP